MGTQSPSILLSSIKQNKGIQRGTPFQKFLKPSLIESRVTDSPDTFNSLGEGFKKLFLENTGSQQASMGIMGAKDLKPPLPLRNNMSIGSSSPKPVVIPIAGYTGHRKGETAENLFGRCFRDVSLKSKIIERGGLQRRNQYVMIDRQGKDISRNGEEFRTGNPGHFTDIRVFNGGTRTF